MYGLIRAIIDYGSFIASDADITFIRIMFYVMFSLLNAKDNNDINLVIRIVFHVVFSLLRF